MLYKEIIIKFYYNDTKIKIIVNSNSKIGFINILVIIIQLNIFK